MRVLTVGNMYPPHHLGGYEITWRASVEHLRRRGDQVRVLTTDFTVAHPDPALADPEDVDRELRWYWRDHGWPQITAPQRLRLERHNQAVLGRITDDFDPDLVVWWAMGGMSLSLIETVRRRGLPAAGVVLDDWMTYAFEADAWMRIFERRRALVRPAELLARLPARVDLDRAASWAFISEATRSKALARVALGRTRVIHAGIDHELFGEQPDHEWEGRLLYAGRIDARKGIETAIQALEHLPDATLTIDGPADRHELPRLQGIAEAHGLRDRVEFAHTARGDLAGRYAEADAVLFPVLWEEPWGLVPLEAMAVGTPVIATGVGGSGEYLRDDVNCLLFAPPDAPGALASAVSRLAADRGLRRRLRAAGLSTAREFDQRRFGGEVAELLDSTLD